MARSLRFQHNSKYIRAFGLQLRRDLVDFIDAEGVFPSHAQTIRMKELSRAGRLNTDIINEIMREQKGNQKEKISVPVEHLQKYFSRGASPKTDF